MMVSIQYAISFDKSSVVYMRNDQILHFYMRRKGTVCNVQIFDIIHTLAWISKLREDKLKIVV